MPLKPLTSRECPVCLTSYKTELQAAACRQIDAGDGWEKRQAHERRQKNIAGETQEEK